MAHYKKTGLPTSVKVLSKSDLTQRGRLTVGQLVRPQASPHEAREHCSGVSPKSIAATRFGLMSDRKPWALSGVTLSAPPPIGHISIPLSKGLNVLYGKNGVGKSKLLQEVSALVQRESDAATKPSLAPDEGPSAYVDVLWDPL